MIQFNRGSSGWAAYDISSITGATVTGSPSAIIEPNGSLDLIGIASNGHMIQFNRGSSGWAAYDQSTSTGTVLK